MPNVTLLTDLGLQDASTGIVKGILYSTIPGVIITDISHEVSPFDVAQAAYILGNVYSSFPAGTVHLVLVDVYYAAVPKLILAKAGSQYLLVPDNGIVPAALNGASYKTWLCYEHTGAASHETFLRTAAEVIHKLEGQTPASIGLQSYLLQQKQQQTPQDDKTVTCNILYIDNFGNLVTDMTKQRFDQLNRNGRFIVSVGVDTIDRISTSYTDVVKGDPLCRFNSRGYLEICVFRDNASALLGFRVGGIYNDIKITFE